MPEEIDLTRIHEFDLKDIFADEEFNCRGFIDPLSVYELAKEIEEKGLIQPITVQPWDRQHGKHWRIVAGYRRYKAFCVNAAKSEKNPKTIPCIVKVNLSELDAVTLNISENTNRANLNILQEAKSLRPLINAGWNPARIAKETGQYHSWVTTRIKLLELPKDIQDEAAAGLLKANDIVVLSKMPTLDSQIDWVKKLKNAKLVGKKPQISKVVKLNQNKARSDKEILALQDVVIDNLGLDSPGSRFAIQALGWASGLIDDITFHAYASKVATAEGKYYPDYSNFLTRDQMVELETTI